MRPNSRINTNTHTKRVNTSLLLLRYASVVYQRELSLRKELLPNSLQLSSALAKSAEKAIHTSSLYPGLKPTSLSAARSTITPSHQVGESITTLPRASAFISRKGSQAHL